MSSKGGMRTAVRPQALTCPSSSSQGTGEAPWLPQGVPSCKGVLQLADSPQGMVLWYTTGFCHPPPCCSLLSYIFTLSLWSLCLLNQRSCAKHLLPSQLLTDYHIKRPSEVALRVCFLAQKAWLRVACPPQLPRLTLLPLAPVWVQALGTLFRTNAKVFCYFKRLPPFLPYCF